MFTLIKKIKILIKHQLHEKIPSHLYQNHRPKLKKYLAFTLAEAILTMMILGILAATMVTTLKPSQYKQQAFDTQKRKMYSEIDGILTTILTDCTADTSLKTIYENCDRTTTPFVVLSAATRNKFAQLFNNYVRGTYYPAGEERTICTASLTHPVTKQIGRAHV